MNNVEEWRERLGFYRVLTIEHVERIEGTKSTARKAATKARRSGKVPIYVANGIEDAKNAAWVDETIIELRTAIDMQVVHTMKDHGCAGLITLDYVRSGFKALQNAARNVTLLHKGRVPILLASGARKVSEMRAPRDIAAVGRILGLSIPQALSSVSENWEGFI